MRVNCDKPQRWKRDIALSVDLYNAWFLEFAPNTYREERVRATGNVEVMPRKSKRDQLPVMIEAKSAGDFTNTNKRRKEEATKIGQLKRMHGDAVQYVLFLCGYFDSGYLGYEAAEGIDWVWEHRIDDLKYFGL